MAVFEQLVMLLTDGQARFRVLEHPAEGKPALVAAIRGTLPGQGAKAMLCKNKDQDNASLVLAVLPGDRKVDFKKVAQAVGMRKATLASANEAMEATGCVIGAIPPFALTPDIRLVVDPELVSSYDEIAFNAGRLDRSILLNTSDYVSIAKPSLAPLCS